MIFLILVTCKNKSTSASFLRQKIHSPQRFPSLFLSSLESFSAKLGKHVTLWFALTSPSLKWLTEKKNPKSLLSFQNAQRDTTNFVINVKPSTVLLLPSSIIAVNIFDEAFTDMPVFALVLIPSTWAFHSILLADFLSQIDSHTFLFTIVIFHKDEFSPTLSHFLDSGADFLLPSGAGHLKRTDNSTKPPLRRIKLWTFWNKTSSWSSTSFRHWISSWK